MNAVARRFALMVAASLLLAVTGVRAAEDDTSFPPKKILGTWEGDANVTSEWVNQKTLHVAISITSDTHVVGTVGDAKLVDGLVERGVGPIARALGLKRFYVVTADLDGPLIAAEGIKRDSVFIELDVKDSQLIGEIRTNGSKSGGKMVETFTAEGLVLAHPAAATQPGQ
jgi:hypothetical protein